MTFTPAPEPTMFLSPFSLAAIITIVIMIGFTISEIIRKRKRAKKRNEDVKPTPEGWYCDYCGNKNLTAIDVCADCLKYNGGEIDVF